MTEKLDLLKRKRFTPEGKPERVAASLDALNAAQPTELTPAEWQEILEETEEP